MIHCTEDHLAVAAGLRDALNARPDDQTPEECVRELVAELREQGLAIDESHEEALVSTVTEEVVAPE